MTLPKNMVDRWARRHDPMPGERTLYWHVLMADHPEVGDLARQAAERLALFNGLHMTPLDKLHMTTLVVGPAEQASESQMHQMAKIAAEHLNSVRPIPVSLGKILYHSEAIVLAVTPGEALAPIRAAAAAATEHVGITAVDGFGWAPHITLCYSTADQPAGPIVDALGMQLPGREISVSSLSLVLQDGPERSWDWTIVGTIRLDSQLSSHVATTAAEGIGIRAGNGTPYGRAIPPEAANRLRTAMLQMASRWGDAHPESIKAVATTFDLAREAATPGSIVMDDIGDEPAYLIVMSGYFTAYRHGPSGRPPTGRYLKVTADSSTLKVTDAGLSDDPPRQALETYGPVADLT